MGYGNRNSRRSDANYRPCPSCETPVYWRDGPYCYSCNERNPERHCGACNQVSRTLGTDCLHCEKPLGRLTFGQDRLAAGKQRIGGWTAKAPDPAAVWEVAPGVHYFRGEVDDRPLPVVKGFAPGIGFPESGTDPGNRAYLASIRKGEGDPGTTWRTCFVCGDHLRGGKGDYRFRFRFRIVAPQPGERAEDRTQPAHIDCRQTDDERAIVNAASYVRSLRNKEQDAKREAALQARAAASRLNGGPGMAAIVEGLASASAA